MRIKIPEDEPYLESIPESPRSLNPSDNEMPTEPIPPRTYKEYSEKGIRITNLGTIEEIGNETPALYSPDRHSLEPQSPDLASLRLARMLLGGGSTSPYFSTRISADAESLDMSGVKSPSTLFGSNLVERASGLKSEKEVLQDKVDELQDIVRKQNKEEHILQNKVRYLEDLVEHMTSNKIVLAEETSKALSSLRGELSKLKLCNTEIPESSRDKA